MSEYVISPNQQTVVDFLTQETFTTPKQIQLLLAQNTIQATYQLLDRMVQNRLISKVVVPLVQGRGVTLYGITSHGLNFATYIEKYINNNTFQKSKISTFTLQHKLDIQTFHILTTRHGWFNWMDGSELGRRDKNQKIPDAIVTTPDKQVVAMEIEREAKSIRRYRDIIVSHLLSRKNGQWDKVIYLCPSPKLARTLKVKFHSIKSINYNGITISLTEKHFQIFEFYAYEEFEKKMKFIK